jgi:hypothetical protein
MTYVRLIPCVKTQHITHKLKDPVYTKGAPFEAHIGKVPVHDFQQARGIIS